MIGRFLPLVTFVFAFALVGCGGEPVKAPSERSLSIAEWEQLPDATKFQAESYERLKAGEPKFQDERAWDRFYRTKVAPGRMKAAGAATK